MLNKSILHKIISRILKIANPSKVVLFGSQAKKTATDDSDIDLLVVEPYLKNKGEEIVKLRNAIGDIGKGVDILLYSEKEINEWGSVMGTALHSALKEGKIIYETKS